MTAQGDEFSVNDFSDDDRIKLAIECGEDFGPNDIRVKIVREENRLLIEGLKMQMVNGIDVARQINYEHELPDGVDMENLVAGWDQNEDVLIIEAPINKAIVPSSVSGSSSKSRSTSVKTNYSTKPAVDECVGASLREEDSKTKSRRPSKKSMPIADGPKSSSMPKQMASSSSVLKSVPPSPLIKSESSKQISKPIDPKQPKPAESKSKPPMVMTKM